MAIELTHFSVVILAQANNPSILNPDFLKNNSIVDSSFTPANVVCTPPVSHVTYAEGISIVAEFEKLQFIDDKSDRIPTTSPIPAISSKYLQTLPHVKYTAVGINLSGHREFDDLDAAKSFIVKKFIQEGPWLHIQGEDVAAGINFVYSRDNVKRTISINPGEYKRDKTVPVVTVRYNHNWNAEGSSIENLVAFIANWPEAFKYYTEFCEHLFE